MDSFRYASRLVLIFAASCPAGSSNAQSFVVEFGQSGTVASDGSVFNTTGTAGGAVTIDVFLTQIAPEMRLNNAATGLTLADLIVDVSAGGVELTPTAINLAPSFSNVINTGITGQSAQIDVAGGDTLFGSFGVITNDDGTADTSILLGSIDYAIGATAVGPFTLTGSQNGPSGGLFSPVSLANPGFPLGIDVTSNTATIAVTAVPEPSTFALLACGFLVIAQRHRRKSRQAA